MLGELDPNDRELESLIQAFCADPSDDLTFGRLDVLIRAGRNWEIVPDPPRDHGPPSEKRA